MKKEIKNAIIKSTMLGLEDHGIFTAYIFLEGDGWGCGFGGYSMDEYDKNIDERVGHGFGIDFIKSILDVVGVDKWEDLEGKHLRAETEGWGGKITKIGNIVKEKWFDPDNLVQKYFINKD